MNDFLSLRILDRFQWIFERLGCDYDVMRMILQVKLTMDGRRVPTIMSRAARYKSQKDSDDKNSFVRSLWIYMLMGLILVPFMLMKQDYMFQMSVAYGILMFFITTSMISDFSSVLLDIRDRVIISTKPVNKRTVSFARSLHIVIYLFLLTGSLTAPSLIAALYGQGIIFFLIYLIGILLMDILVVVVTALLYLLILNFFDGERLKDIINYFQIALSLAMVVGYQLVGRSFSVFRLHIVFHTAWWQVVVPPFWFGAGFDWIMGGHASKQLVLFSLLALLIPILLFIAYIRLMPSFERKLQKLATSDARGIKGKGGVWLLVIARVIGASGEEWLFFRFAFLMMAREREFKLKVYPSLGLSLILPFLTIFNSARTSGLQNLSSSEWYLSIYSSAIVIPTVLMMLKYSGQYKASWIYKTTPIRGETAIFKGTIKAALIRLFFPIYLLLSVVFAVLFGVRIIPDLIVSLLSITLYTVIVFRVTNKVLPFSEPFQLVQQSGRYTVILLMLLIAVFVIIQFAATFFQNGIYIYMLLLILFNAAAWRFGFRLRPARGV